MATATHDTEKALLRETAAGSESAFTSLFDRYQARIYSIGLALTRSETLAEELVQDIFMTCWLRRASLGGIDNFSAYLFIMTRNAAYHMLRQLAAQQYKHEEWGAGLTRFHTDTGQQLEAADLARVLAEVVATLPEQQRRAFLLIKEQGMSREQAAAAMGIAPNTLKIHLGRAVKTVRAWCLTHLDLPAALWLFWLIH